MIECTRNTFKQEVKEIGKCALTPIIISNVYRNDWLQNQFFISQYSLFMFIKLFAANKKSNSHICQHLHCK